MFALAILPLAVTAIAYAVTAGQMQAAEALRQSRAATLAEALMEEILAKPYEDPEGASTPGPDEGEISRADFDNADDYHGYNEPAGGLKNSASELYPAEWQRFSRSVTCAPGSVTLAGLSAATPGLTITVTVSEAGTAVCTLTRFVVAP